MPATGFLVVRISAACMALASGMSPSPESFETFEEPAWIRVLPSPHQRPGPSGRTLLRSSARDTFLESPDFQLRVRQHCTNKNTHVLMEDCEEPHLLTDCTRRTAALAQVES